MKQSYYLYKSGRLQRKDNTLEIVYKDNTKKSIPVERVDDIYVMTELDFNTSLLNFLSQFGINVHFFNYYGFYTGTYYPKEALVSGKLLIKQVEHYNDKEKRLNIAKAFIEAASYNIYRNLTYYNNRGKNLKDYMTEIDYLRKQIKLCKDVPELMGIEGNIRKVYYDSWNIIINQDIAFEKRVKNPPDNAINSLISYVNTIIYTRVLSEIYKTQLNPTISYLHEPSERRFSLCLDIAEIFKPIIADRLIFSMLNKRQITEKDFDDIPEVDSKLLKLAQVMNGKVVTNDYNLNKVAQFQGVEVLNINQLANAVKPVAIPGEEMVAQVVKEGKESNQGIAYLDDGTMIVVEGGKKHIGQTINVLVTSVLQTSAGRMIFGKPKN